jgi:hypothetical protein
LIRVISVPIFNGDQNDWKDCAELPFAKTKGTKEGYVGKATNQISKLANQK